MQFYGGTLHKKDQNFFMMNLIAKYTRCGAQQVWIYYFLCLFNSLLSYPKKAKKKSLRRLFYECRYHLTSFDYYCTTAESEDFFSFSSLMTTKTLKKKKPPQSGIVKRKRPLVQCSSISQRPTRILRFQFR